MEMDVPTSLADGISYCIVDGTAIFLDLHRDRYIAARADLLPSAGSAACGMVLRDRRLVTGNGSADDSVAPACVQIATKELSRGRFSSRATEAFMAMMDTLLVERRLGRSGLAAAVSHLELDRRRRVFRIDADWSEYESALAPFLAIDRLRDQTVSCLTRSLAIHRALSRRSLPATLVIGVKLGPFAAHAWLQHGNVVLTDLLERTGTYRPIASF